ncbi:MAG: cyclic nucleotide-binding domain-containing protein [Deltaproteobacteria bacterium]|nr:cyclic nucleotide-binding domain-containing protein [Deltaproteobacteria bacterium]
MSQNPDIIARLKSAALFKNFTDTGLQIIASITHEKRVPAGAPLFVENMIGDGLYIVAQGSIRLSVRGPRGEELRLGTLGPGDSLGEAALLRAGPTHVLGHGRDGERGARDLPPRAGGAPAREAQAVLKLMMGWWSASATGCGTRKTTCARSSPGA